jgi:hypothetical protein
MGALTRFRFTEGFVERFPYFVETGTGRGDGLAYAARHMFDRLYSIECEHELYRHARKRFWVNPRITVLWGESEFWISSLMMGKLSEYPSLIFLDAHLPGVDFLGRSFDAEPDKMRRFPLKTELEIIAMARPDGDYCIIIDDLRIYKDDDWEHGNIGAHVHGLLEDERGLGFLDPFRETHDVMISKRDSGYAIIMPRGVDPPEMEP